VSEFEDLVDVNLVLEQDEKERRALLMLLDKQRLRKDHFLALDSQMGGASSFVTSTSLQWLAGRARFATELPLFKEHVDLETGKITLNNKTAALLQQREPDWSRQWAMTLYLAKRRSHKFPPILVVVSQAWVDNPDSDQWTGSERRAVRDSIDARGLDTEGVYMDLQLNDSDFLYVIDGQHRLMAIKGLVELLDVGSFFMKNRQGKQKTECITVDEIIEQSNGAMTPGKLQTLLSERIGMEIIPAVLKGETRAEALRRVRSIFVHVNRTAVALKKGELVLLNEDDGFAIVARALSVNHDLLKDHVERNSVNLSAKSVHYTTLAVLAVVARLYLSQLEGYSGWKPDSKTEMSVRPEEDDIDRGYQKFSEYLDFLTSLPSHKGFVDGRAAADIRSAGGEDNVLFRPIAQTALAEAVAKLERGGRSLVSIGEILKKKEAEGQLRLTAQDTPWYGVLWDPANERMRKGAGPEGLCHRLFLHLLGGGTADNSARKELRDEFAKARVVGLESDLAIDFEGVEVRSSSIRLPSPW